MTTTATIAPVIGADGTQAWWQNGRRHRLNGPAVIMTCLKHMGFWNDETSKGTLTQMATLTQKYQSCRITLQMVVY
jgi:hypothetical protein